jgi:3-dehydroquinate synthase
LSQVNVALGDRSYSVIIEPGLLSRMGDWIATNCAPSSVVLISHPALVQRYGAEIVRDLEARGMRVTTVFVAPGERSKSLVTAARLFSQLAQAKLDRKGLVIALGGGVIGDLGGYVAATFLRGVRYVQIPTTLLAQVDASVGGKTAVDLPEGKNLVGAFHQPQSVLIDPLTLRSLPMRELRSGLAEVIKYGIILDDSFFEFVERKMPLLLQRNDDALTEAIVRSCQIKAEVVSQDETEQGLRAVLNLGHTVGHAIEALTRYRVFKHGEAVSIGTVTESLVGEELGETDPDLTERIKSVFRIAGLPVDYPSGLDAESMLTAMRGDKKTIAGSVRCVVPRAIGQVVVRDTPDDVLRTAMRRHEQGKRDQ